MGFEWDEEKNRANIAKHGVTFRQASQVFGGHVVSRRDDRRDYGEDRWIAIGRSGILILTVVYTVRAGNIRIISAWRANRQQRVIYDNSPRED